MQKYTKEEMMAIGREIYDHYLTIAQAAEKYCINYYTARDYYRMYRDNFNLPAIEAAKPAKGKKIIDKDGKPSFYELHELSKNQLIEEVIKARIGEERAKKGYEVKGDGQTKEYIILKKENLK